MKREGRQHGMVRTNPILPHPFNPRPVARHVNKLGSPPTAGMFTKVSSKPTNHSKFTGKCGRPRCNGCHIHPACKAKDKTKGAKKLRLITSDILDQLICPYMDDGDDQISSNDVEIEEIEGYDNDDQMSFCEVGFVWEALDGDESWCLVEEM